MSPQMEIRIKDPALGLSAFLVIDRAKTRGVGGLRISEAVDEEEVRALARKMTCKLAFMGLTKLGGAKAGLAIPREADPYRRKALLDELGRRLGPLLSAGVYIPGTDMNSTPEDIAILLRAAGLRPKPIPDSGKYTAMTVFESVRACAAAANLKLSRLTCAIQGFGRVGSRLARLMREHGVLVVAVSNETGTLYDPNGLDVNKLVSLYEHGGQGFLAAYGIPLRPLADLLRLPADILCLCAGDSVVTPQSAATLNAKILGFGSNNPLVAGADRALQGCGLLFVPDYVANAGGVLGSLLASHGVSDKTISSLVEGPYYEMSGTLARRSLALNISPYIITDSLVEKALNTLEAHSSAMEKAGALARRLGVQATRLYGWRDLNRFKATFEARRQEIARFTPTKPETP